MCWLPTIIIPMLLLSTNFEQTLSAPFRSFLILHTRLCILRRASPQAPCSADAAGHLVVGTASGSVLLLTADGMGVHAAFRLPSPPAFVAALGASNAPWRVYVATQYASLHVIDSGKLLAVEAHLDALPAGLVRVCFSMYIGCIYGWWCVCCTMRRSLIVV